jgi:hypothetical protein
MELHAGETEGERERERERERVKLLSSGCELLRIRRKKNNWLWACGVT